MPGEEWKMLSRLSVLLLMDNLFSEQYLPKQRERTISCSFSLVFLLPSNYLSGFSLMTYALLSFILVLAQSSVSLPLLPDMQ